MRFGLSIANVINRVRGSVRGKADRLNLVVCGGARCGTTSFMYYLYEHPEVAPISNSTLTYKGKVIDWPFASFDEGTVKLGSDTDFYSESVMDMARKHLYLATKRTYFISYPFMAANLASHLPDAKLIFLLRNPIEAIHSLYWHQRAGRMKQHKGNTELFQLYREMSFEDYIGRSEDSTEKVEKILSLMAVKGRLERDRELPNFNLNRYLYAQNLQPFLEVFPSSQVHVIKSENLFSDTEGTMCEVLDFLGLSGQVKFTRTNQIRGASNKEHAILPDTRAYLFNYYRESNEYLFKRLGWGEVDWQ